MPRFVVTIIITGLTVVAASTAIAASSSLSPVALSHARAIKAEISARYVRGPKLAVTEASPTDVIESYLLLTPDLLGLRVVSADNGIYYAICPVRATCPYPGPRSAGRRPRSLLAVRRSSSPPGRSSRHRRRSSPSCCRRADFVFFLVERDELAREVDIAALARALRGNPARMPAASLRRSVDEITLPRLFLALGLEPTPSGRHALGAVPLRASP